MASPFRKGRREAKKLTEDVDKVGQAVIFNSGEFAQESALNNLYGVQLNSKHLRNVGPSHLLASISFFSLETLMSDALLALQCLIHLVELSSEMCSIVSKKLLRLLVGPVETRARIGATVFLRFFFKKTDHVYNLNLHKENASATLISDFLHFNFLVPKKVNLEFQKLILKCLTDQSFKNEFTATFLRVYDDLAFAFMEGLGV